MTPARTLLLLAAGVLLERGARALGERSRVEKNSADLLSLYRRRDRRRKPPEAGMPVPAIPPRGPLPKQGGAEAPLVFD